MDEKDKLKIESLKWQIGFRKLLPTILSLLVALVTVYWGYYLPNRHQFKNEIYAELIKSLENSKNLYLQLFAIGQLKNYGEKAVFPLIDLYEKTNNKIIKEKIKNTLLNDFHFEDKIKYLYITESLGESFQKEKWIYIGNYSYIDKKWVDQSKTLGYSTTIDYNSIKKLKPNEIINKIFNIDIITNIRSKYPERYNNFTIFSQKIGVLKKGKKVKILKINESKHPFKHIKRIWAQIEILK